MVKTGFQRGMFHEGKKCAGSDEIEAYHAATRSAARRFALHLPTQGILRKPADQRGPADGTSPRPGVVTSDARGGRMKITRTELERKIAEWEEWGEITDRVLQYFVTNHKDYAAAAAIRCMPTPLNKSKETP